MERLGTCLGAFLVNICVFNTPPVEQTTVTRRSFPGSSVPVMVHAVSKPDRLFRFRPPVSAR